MVKALSGFSTLPVRRTSSPNPIARNKSHIVSTPTHCLLPNTFCVSLPFPSGRRTIKASGDVRKAGENIILLLSLLLGIEKARECNENWIALGKLLCHRTRFR